MNAVPQIDLHTHSRRSDGALEPAALIARAAAAGVVAVALTDHDTVDGLPEAQDAATRHGITLVPGIELSATWRARDIHILGLWIDPASAALRERLAAQTERRQMRMRRMCTRLDRQGLPGAALLEQVECQPGVATRTHLAMALVAGGHVSSVEQAFRRWLSTGKPAYVAAQWPEVAEIVCWIREAGGVASLAHPARYQLSSGARRQLLGEFTAAGGGAIEVVAGANGVSHIEASAMLAQKFGLLASAGSDFHDPQLTWNPLGRLAKLPDYAVPVWRDRGL